MKTEAELIAQIPIFFGEFVDQESVFDEFRISRKESKNVTILYAWYGKDGSRSGSFVLFEKHGSLFEVWACHGKSYGLEYQWEIDTCDLDRLLYEATNAEKAAKKKWNKDKPQRLPGLYLFLTGEEFANGGA
jgi:hypothetical protein